MGVYQYLTLLRSVKPKKKIIIDTIIDLYDLYIIDGNCVLHDVFDKIGDCNIYDSIMNDSFENTIIAIFKTTLNKCNAKKKYIVFDGVPPLPKQVMQKERRLDQYGYRALLLPNTKLMVIIESYLLKHFKTYHNITINNSTIEGEGEQKMYMIIKDEIMKDNTIRNVMVHSKDSDVVILGQIFLKTYHYITLHALINDEDKYGLSISINKVTLWFLNGNYSIERLLLFCCICKNDFFLKHNDFDNCDTLKIYKNFNYSITTWDDLDSKSCDKNCNTIKIKTYVNLYLWYIEYFKSNKNISCKPYTYKESPCCHCIAKLLKTNIKYKENHIVQADKHLEYVLNKSLLSLTEKSLEK